MSSVLVSLVVLALSVWAGRYILQHLTKKLQTQSTTDATAHRVTRDTNPDLFRFHVWQCYVAIALLGVIGLTASITIVMATLFPNIR